MGQRDGLGFRDMGSRGFDKTQQFSSVLGELQIRATKEARLNVARLRTTLDQTNGFEVIEAAIEGAHRLESATREQLATREDGRERLGLVYGARESSENGTRTLGKGFDVGRAKRCAEDDPRQIGVIRTEGGEGG
jgi:hypothetical protein